MDKNAKFKYILSMVIFGTIGIFRKWIPVPSSFLALARATIGLAFLTLFMVLTKKKIDINAVKQNAKYLIPSGTLLGFNWIVLFEAYNYTTVATATLCYYMAPLFMIIASSVLCHEKITIKKWICMAVVLIGMVFVTGVTQSGFTGTKGIILGLIAAAMYATIVILNKQLKDISGYDRTVVQMLITVILLIPYVIITEDLKAIEFTATSIILIVLLGVVHTGIAYVLYFGNVNKIPTIEVAILSYIDPALSVILAALLLGEKMTTTGIIGTIMVLAALVVSEIEKSNN